MNFNLRLETKKDYRTVEELTREAFWNINVPGCNEHFVIHKLRESSAFITELDFVAESDGKIIGNIVYTHSIIIDNEDKKHNVITFGPISVLPEFQKQGVGSSLIKHSLKKATELGFSAVLIYGNPRYYSRFGFRCAEKYDIKTADGKYAVALMGLELNEGFLKNVSGRFYEDTAFDINQAEFEKFEATFLPKEKCVTESQREFSVIASMTY